jgi:GNAT superfamily N-acetyltransferase
MGEALQKSAARLPAYEHEEVSGGAFSAPELPPVRLAEVESVLRDKGVITETIDPKSNERVRVIDLERLANDKNLDGNLRVSVKDAGGTEYRFTKREMLFKLLENEVGITPDQLENGDFMPQPFLFVPTSVDAATQSRHIKNAKFHKGIWELSGTNSPFAPHPTKDDEGEISQREVQCAVAIFHPKFGDAYRDETGELLMRDPTTREYKNFSWTALAGYGISDVSIMKSNSERLSTLHEAMRARLPNMVKNRLLQPESDVRVLTIDSKGTARRFEKEIKNPRYVMYGGVYHYIDGSSLKGTFSFRVIGNIGVLRNLNSGKTDHTFTIVDKANADLNPSGQYFAGAKKSAPRNVIAADFTPPQRDYESSETFKGRLGVVDWGIQELLARLEEFPFLASLIRADDETVRRGLGDALRFIAETKNADSLLSTLSKNIGEEGARSLLRVYSELMQAADTMERFIREQFACEDQECEKLVHEARQDVLRRAQLLVQDGVMRTDSLQDLLKKLSDFQTSATVFASAFKSFQRLGENISWEDIKQSSFEQVVASELVPNDVQQMKKIWEAHYTGKYDTPGLEDDLRAEFSHSLKSNNVRVHLFKHEGRVVSYFFAEDRAAHPSGKKERHLASFLTDPSYSGGGLGMAIMQEGLKREQEGAVLVGEADVDPVRTPIVSQYFERYGFVAGNAYADHGEPTLKLERWEGGQFKTKDLKLTKEIIKSRIDAGSAHPHQQYLKSATVPNFESLLQDGYYLTRYFVENDAITKQPIYYAVLERPST